jgi:hypothetical protein
MRVDQANGQHSSLIVRGHQNPSCTTAVQKTDDVRDARLPETAFAHPAFPLYRRAETACVHRYCALQQPSRPKMWRLCNVLN